MTPDTSLNTYLREHKNLLGTKFMCLEGGCGVCTVTLRRVHPVTKRKYTIAVNSCLIPVLACDGCEIETIEYLKDQKDGFHPIQKRLAEYNGTQCGYCSPAMVMGMYSLLEATDGRVSMKEVENSLGGHICRCTGYRPILDAFKSMSYDATDDRKRNPTTGDIEDMPIMCKRSSTKWCSGTCTRDAGNRKCFVPVEGIIPSALNGDLKADDVVTVMTVENEEEGKELAVAATAMDFEWHKAVALDDIFEVFAGLDPAESYMLLCGNTAHGVYRRADNIRVFIDVNNVAELRAHSVNDERLEVGGNVTLSEFMAVLMECAKSRGETFAYGNELAQHIDLVATTAVRNVSGGRGRASVIRRNYSDFV